ncbi:MAG: DUF3558 domain-containing protein [Mycobacteriaceae bacterium]|nr:DUF3558 domain-containing protein [Mycobacteriaceae bacterium]
MARLAGRAWLSGAIAVLSATGGVTACAAAQPKPTPPAPAVAGFNSGDCNLVSDAEINAAAGTGRFTKVVVNDAGCFWQENSMIGMFGAGMGISTWWYRGSDVDTERTLERAAGRKLAELSLNGNHGFEASDANACSVYVSKGPDVITWSIQSMNIATLPPLCTVVHQLAQLTQDRAN